MKDDYLIYNRKGTFVTEKGYLVSLRMRLWQYPHRKESEFPEGYQLSWIVFKLTSKRERVLFDNHVDKLPHYHDNEKEAFFTWKSLLETEKMFFQMVYQKFGYFNYE
ncbi:hypothetical protein [endosymbiont GvMRE of Glomus versiforme]|uniref:hypothetical protein n=1 Tax=endosymbiont GvMRE of Glomus versiforme TaxID=2039283 RepID=UPI000EEF7291|nr:hypothetical protein [endosymbiont GvMRE of Glomus versiforme]RHZ36145.1 hypothetical protein GvMRE_Ic2g14 [endosymbiont GvMRE of Glomus versiforme]